MRCIALRPIVAGGLLVLVAWSSISIAQTTEPPAPAALSRLESYIASLKERKEPISPADLAVTPVPDEENAAWYLKQAADAVTVPGPRNAKLQYGPALPYGAEWDRQAAQMMQANARLFELAREARNHPAVDWKTGFERVNGVNAPSLPLPALKKLSGLQRELADAILYHHFRGDDAAAMEVVEDALFAADAVGKCPTLVCYLVSSQMRAVANQSIQAMATGLSVEGAAHPSDSAAARPVNRAEVEKLIRVLLDDEPLRRQHRFAFQSERLVQLVNLEGQPDVWAGGFLESYLAVMDEAIDASRRPHLTPMPPAPDKDPAGLVPQVEPTRRQLFESLLSDRAAAIGLAVRLYWHETGRYPAKLAELAPAYLPAVPADPLASDDRPLGYLLTADGKRPVVWSVGRDGVAGKWDEAAIRAAPTYLPVPVGHGIDDVWIDLSDWNTKSR